MDCASLFRYAENCYDVFMNRSFVKKFNVTTALSVVVFFVLCAIALIFVSCTSQRSPADGNAIEALEAVEASSPEGVDILVFAQNLVKKHVGIAKLVSISDFCESANAFDEDRKKALEAGMSGYLAKPIKQEALLAVLNEFLD